MKRCLRKLVVIGKLKILSVLLVWLSVRSLKRRRNLRRRFKSLRTSATTLKILNLSLLSFFLSLMINFVLLKVD